MKSVSWNEHVRLAQKQSKRVGRKWAVILITCRCASASNRMNCGACSEGHAEPKFMMIEITMNCDGGHRNAQATGLD